MVELGEGTKIKTKADELDDSNELDLGFGRPPKRRSLMETNQIWYVWIYVWVYKVKW